MSSRHARRHRRRRRLPAYLPLVIEHARQLGIGPDAHVHVEVRHDDDCAHWRYRPCDCEPQVVSGPAIDARWGIAR